MLTQLPPGALIAISGPRSEKPTLLPTWRRPPTAMHARAVGRRADGVAGGVAGRGDDDDAGGREPGHRVPVRCAAGAGAAQAHVDDLGRRRVGRQAEAASSAACRRRPPTHADQDVGVVAAALAEHAHRQHVDVAADAGDADAVVGRSRRSGRASACRARSCSARGCSRQRTVRARGIDLGLRDPVARVARRRRRGRCRRWRS